MSQNQVKPKKIIGLYKIIAQKTGSNEDYVSRVINKKVETKGKKAKKILETYDVLYPILSA